MLYEDKLMTAEELMQRQPPHLRSELINGRMIVREPAAFKHGRVALAIGAQLYAWVGARGVGVTVGAETGFTLRRNPDTVRAPDAAFISTARLPSADVKGFAELTPDLVVEVLSPSDRTRDVRAKVTDWLSAGAQLVWVLDAECVRADVYRSNGTSDRVGASGALDGEDMLPGFRLPLHSLFGA